MSGLGALGPGGDGARRLQPFALVTSGSRLFWESGEEALTSSLVDIPFAKTAKIQRQTLNSTLEKGRDCVSPSLRNADVEAELAHDFMCLSISTLLACFPFFPLSALALLPPASHPTRRARNVLAESETGLRLGGAEPFGRSPLECAEGLRSFCRPFSLFFWGKGREKG